MKILVVMPAGYLEFNNGTSIRVKNVFRVLEAKYAVTLVGKSLSHDTVEPGVVAVRMLLKSQGTAAKIINHLWWYVRLLFFLTTTRCDLLYYFSPHPYLFPLYKLLSKLKRFKIIFEVVGHNEQEGREVKESPFSARSILTRLSFVPAIRGADLVVAVSDNLAEVCRQYNQNTETVRFSVATFTPSPAAKKQWHKRYGIAEDRKVVGMVGPFADPFNENYLQFLRRSMADFDERIVFVLIGRDAEQIRHPRVMCTGYVQEYDEALNMLDAALFPANLKTYGPLTRILDCMAHGIPVIATEEAAFDIDGLVNRYNIVICPESEMATTVNAVIFDDALMTGIAGNALEAVQKFYSEKNETQMLQVVAKLVG